MSLEWSHLMLGSLNILLTTLIVFIQKTRMRLC